MKSSRRLVNSLLLVGILSLCLAGLSGLYDEIAFGQNKLADVNPQALLDMASARAEVTSEWEAVFELLHATSEKLYQDTQGRDVFEYSDIAKGHLEELAEQLDAMKIPAFENPVFQALESACSSCAEAYKPYNEAMEVWSISKCADKLRGAAAKLLEILQQFSQARFELIYHHDWTLESDVHQRYESIVTEGELWEAYEAGTLAAPEENPEQRFVDYLNGEVEALQILKTAIEDNIASVTDKSGGFADSYGIYDLLCNFKRFVQSDLDYLAAVIALLGPINTAPSATSQPATTDEDTAVDIVLIGDDPDGDPLTFRIITQPTNGSLTGAAPNLTYAPNPDYNGSDSFTFTVNDSAVDSEPATVSITISPVNDPPVVSAADLFIKEDTPGRIKVEISDVDGDALTTDVFGGPHFGRLTGGLPNLTYTPNKDYNGMDTFTVIARDGVASGKASVNIFVDPVNDAPVAQGQSVTTNEDTPLPITLVASDVDGDPLTYNCIRPVNGKVAGSPPNVTYTPNKDWPTGHGSGNDSFTFLVTDGKLSATATISITVNAVNDLPVANPQSVTTNEDTPLPITLTGSDVDGDKLTFSIAKKQPSNGSLTGSGAQVTYTPNPNWPTGHQPATDSFTFQVDDGWGSTDTAGINIIVNAVNDPPHPEEPAPPDYLVTTDEDTPVLIPLRCRDDDLDRLSFCIIDGPFNGKLDVPTPTTAPSKVSNVDGFSAQVTYTPNENWPTGHEAATDRFGIQVEDGHGSGFTTYINITVNAVNDLPVPEDISVTTDEDEETQITLQATDADLDESTFRIVTPPTNGTWTGTLCCTDEWSPTITYTPNENYNGSDSFTYVAVDGDSGETSEREGTVSITINPVNDPPEAFSQSVTTSKDKPVQITLSAEDVEEDSLTFHVNQPIHGSLTGTAPTVTYNPDPDYDSDSFTFTVDDGEFYSEPATVNIRITTGEEGKSAEGGQASEQVMFTQEWPGWKGYDIEKEHEGVVNTYKVEASLGSLPCSLHFPAEVNISFDPTKVIPGKQFPVFISWKMKNGSGYGDSSDKYEVFSNYGINFSVSVTTAGWTWFSEGLPGDWSLNIRGDFIPPLDNGTHPEKPWDKVSFFDLSNLIPGWPKGFQLGTVNYKATVSVTGHYITADMLATGPIGRVTQEELEWQESGEKREVDIFVHTDAKAGELIKVSLFGIVYGVAIDRTTGLNLQFFGKEVGALDGQSERVIRPEEGILSYPNSVEFLIPVVEAPPVTLAVKAIAEVVEGYLGDIPVTSEKPVSAHITVNNEQVKRITTFTESFPQNSEVTLEAETRITRTGTTYFFDRWECDCTEVERDPNDRKKIKIALTEDTTCTAFYLPPDYNE